MISKAFEDIRIGETSTTEWRSITEDYVRCFAEITWDRHPLHLNPAYAERTRFGRQIAHGALMVSTLLGLVDLHPAYLQCFYGLDQLRFHAPVYFGDRVHAVTEVVELRVRSDSQTGVVTSKASLFKEDGELAVSGLFSFLVAGHARAIDVEAVAR
ncbi:MaoC family dehydratase N-terminal domain-containing protein (plasmid) [Rhodococcus sp. USK10]|uniref:MaoC/PaaZ C-terminal domain-containing protein n=1 Tax=Rhodococcus sp. USK10 TaxID=2789739 RepID=UPI001C5F5134|nr:MaoC/PaaZ C-terminal domain-containing protein [Rhodococcus sp. USK10]QYB00235.1 MaoC family dehydratase N-terminal domain-containing protein [Rhodococcus sp. USK10]